MKRRVLTDDEAVSPVIATILMVAITVVLAATLYMMLPKGGTSGTQMTGRFGEDTMIENNDYKFTVASLSEERSVSQLKFRLETPNGSGFFEFSNHADGVQATMNDGTNDYTLNYTDIGGNDIINTGDYFVLAAGADSTAELPSGSYTFTMLSDGNEVTSVDFTV